MLGNYQFAYMTELLTGVVAMTTGFRVISSIKYFDDVTPGERLIIAMIAAYFVLWGLNRVAPYLDELADWAMDKIHNWAIKNMKKNKIPLPK